MRSLLVKRWTLLSAACAVVVFSTTPVFSQTRATQKGAAAATSDVQDLVRKGIAAYRKNDLPAARQALLEAIRIGPEPSFVAMLADIEMKLGRFRDAAEHWTYYLTLLSEDQVKERVEATTQIATCREHVGLVAFEGVPEGAVVLLDGNDVERDSSRGELWVEPGTYTIQAMHGTDSSPTQTIVVHAGERLTVNLAVAPPAVGAPVSPRLASANPKTAPSHAVAAPIAPETESNARTYVLIGGAALTAVAAGIGVAYLAANQSAKKDEDAAWHSLEQATDDAGICSSVAPPPACSELQSARDRMKRTADLSDVSFVVAGVLGAATIGSYLLWPNREGAPRRGALQASPFWSPTHHGVMARVRF